MPLISVIVPVYKVENYLDRCVQSILKQTFEDYELILIEDGSPDRCPELCDKWKEKDSRILVIHQKNQGLSAARNAGIRIAKGDYLTFVDSDDWIAPDMLEVLYHLLLQYQADIAVCGFMRTASPEAVAPADKGKETVFGRDEFLNVILKIRSNRTIHYAWGKLYKRKVIDSEHYPVGMLNEDVEGMFKAAIRSEKIVETTRIGYFYFENQDSITRKKFGENFLCLHEVWCRIYNIAEKEAPQYLERVDFNLKRSDFTILVDMLLYGDREADQKYAGEIESARKRLKRNIGCLLKGPMVLRRKAVVVLICYLYRPIRFVCRLR